MPLSPPAREGQRFPRHRVPSTNRQPSAGCLVSPTVATRWSLTAPFRLKLSRWARSPWAPPAATGGTCLDRTPPTGFCNLTKTWAHLANDHSSHQAAFPTLGCLGTPRLWAALLRSYRLGPRRKRLGHAGRSRPSQLVRGGNRGPLELLRTPRIQLAARDDSWSMSPEATKPRPDSRPAARTVTASRQARGALCHQEARLDSRSVWPSFQLPPSGGFQNNHTLFEDLDCWLWRAS